MPRSAYINGIAVPPSLFPLPYLVNEDIYSLILHIFKAILTMLKTAISETSPYRLPGLGGLRVGDRITPPSDVRNGSSKDWSIDAGV